MGHGAARDRVVLSDSAGVRYEAVADFFERFGEAFAREMTAFVGSCRGDRRSPVELADATEAIRIGTAITRSLRSGQAQSV